MKRKHLLSLVVSVSLILICAGVQAQEFDFDRRAVYQLTYQTDSNDVETRKTMHMELLLNDSESLFQSLRQRRRDSILYFHNRQAAEVYSKAGGIVMRPVNPFSYKIVKRGDDVQVYDSAFRMTIEGKENIYSYRESLLDLDWRIKEDAIHVGRYICQRADLRYGGRQWTAWFTTAIPISEGPYKFAGLPGLIVRMADEKETWVFDLVLLEQAPISHAINFQKWYIIQNKSKQAWSRDRYEYQHNLPVIASGARFEDGDMAYQRTVMERFVQSLKKDNNWIERYP